MTKETILVIDDEEDILELIKYNLIKEGYKVECVISGEEAIAKAKSELPDLIVLDLMLPGVDGLDICKQLKSNSNLAHIPIIMLTAKSEDSDIVIGLELGADDYITKPFSPRVLIARIKVLLRRGKKNNFKATDNITVHDLIINLSRHQVFVRDKSINLTATEFEILRFLARKPGWVFTRNQIIDAVRGEDYAITERSIDVQIVGLRKKIGTECNYIETVRGVGYRFKD